MATTRKKRRSTTKSKLSARNSRSRIRSFERERDDVNLTEDGGHRKEVIRCRPRSPVPSAADFLFPVIIPRHAPHRSPASRPIARLSRHHSRNFFGKRHPGRFFSSRRFDALYGGTPREPGVFLSAETDFAPYDSRHPPRHHGLLDRAQAS